MTQHVILYLKNGMLNFFEKTYRYENFMWPRVVTFFKVFFVCEMCGCVLEEMATRDGQFEYVQYGEHFWDEGARCCMHTRTLQQGTEKKFFTMSEHTDLNGKPRQTSCGEESGWHNDLFMSMNPSEYGCMELLWAHNVRM
jgi:hypothetical protein